MLKGLLLSAVCFSVFATAPSIGCEDTFSNGKFYIGASAGLGRFKGKCDRLSSTYPYRSMRVLHWGSTPRWDGSGKKTAAVFDVFVGGECCLGSLVFGVDGSFGKSARKVKYQTQECGSGSAPLVTQVPSFAIGEQWHVSLLPRIGVLVLPGFELYALAGLQTSALKVCTAGNSLQPSFNSVFMVTKKTKRNDLVWGGGAKVDLCDDLFAKVEYNCIPFKKVKVHWDTHRQVRNVRYGGHVVKLGLAFKL